MSPNSFVFVCRYGNSEIFHNRDVPTSFPIPRPKRSMAYLVSWLQRQHARPIEWKRITLAMMLDDDDDDEPTKFRQQWLAKFFIPMRKAVLCLTYLQVNHLLLNCDSPTPRYFDNHALANRRVKTWNLGRHRYQSRRSILISRIY